MIWLRSAVSRRLQRSLAYSEPGADRCPPRRYRLPSCSTAARLHDLHTIPGGRAHPTSGKRVLCRLQCPAALSDLIVDDATYPRTARVGIPDTSTVRSATAKS